MSAVKQPENNTLKSDKNQWFLKLYPGTWYRFPQVWVGECLISPDTALEVLTKRNTHNRPKVPLQIDIIARALSIGHFLFTGETIIYDDEGVLLNGQNRHQACLESGKPMHSLVVVGVSRDVFKVLDQHSRRTMGHVLHMMDVKYATAVAAAINFIHFLQQTGSVAKPSGLTITTEERLQILEEHPGLADSGVVANYRRNGRIDIKSAGLLLLLHYLFASYDHETADQFFQELAGERAMPERPGRNTLDILKRQLRANQQSTRGHWPTEHVAALVIKVWNLVMAGLDKELLQWRQGGQGEAFPLPWGWHVENKKLVFRKNKP